MRNRSRRFSSTIGIVLSLIVVLLLFILTRNRPNQIITQQASQPVAELIGIAGADSPLPTPFTPVVVFEPTWTPLPTVPPPPTPTPIVGSTVTPLPLPIPASNASGTLLYTVRFPGDLMDVYALPVDKEGIPIGTSVKLNGDTQGNGRYAYLSPDGNRVLLEDGWGVRYLLAVEQGKTGYLYKDNPEPGGQFFNWHPDSNHILIRADANDPNIGLWLVDVETEKRIVLLAQRSPFVVIGGDVSPNGQEVAYSVLDSATMQSELAVVDTNASERRSLYKADFMISSISWSPDNTKIAFIGDGLMIINFDGSNPRSLSRNIVNNYNFRFAWSPDSTHIAFVAYEPFTSSQHGEMKVLSLEEQLLQAFINTNVHVVDVNSGKENMLIADGSSGNIDPSWSPDGTQIAFASYRNNIGEVWVLNVDGTNLRGLIRKDQPIRHPMWSKLHKSESTH